MRLALVSINTNYTLILPHAQELELKFSDIILKVMFLSLMESE